MRVPLSWLGEFVELPASAEELAEALTMGGLEVAGVERPSAGVRGVVVSEVNRVEPVPGSDKLNLVEVTDGRESYEMVAGAANMVPGDRVAAALPGATLPGPESGEPVRIDRRKIFGHVSDGMLASVRELGVGPDHTEIWVLGADAPLGADVAEWLGLDDPVLELEVTPDRGYALSILGVARDVAALTGGEASLPEPDRAVADLADPPVPVSIHDPDRCPRFDARTVTGVTVGRSPAWLARRLYAAGLRPVSTVVDATNHTMLETGNPVHAYDLARLAGPEIEVRTARDGETLTTLDGVARTLDPDDLVIADADGPVALAGVMGGEATEIGPDTTTLLLEVANFSATTVLRTARRHRLPTEGSMRWERSVPPESVPVAASRCTALITQVAGGRVTATADHYPAPRARPTLRLRTARARGHLGLDLDVDRQRALLERIGCQVDVADSPPRAAGVPPEPGGDSPPAAGGETVLAVTPPAYRPDLDGEADLYEELARLHGYERIPESVPSTGAPGGRGPEHDASQAVRRALVGGGWTEVVVFPFVAEADLAALGLADDDRRRRPLALVNPLSKEDAALRTTLLPGLLRTLRHNVNRQISDVAIYEAAHVFLPPDAEDAGAPGGPEGLTLPAEPLSLGLAACGSFEPVRHDRDARQVDVYDLLGAVELARLAVRRGPVEAQPTDEAPFHPGRAARVRVDDMDVGVVGELHPRVVAAFELPERTVAGELRLDRLIAGGVRLPQAKAPSPLPGVRFDVAVVVDEEVPAAAVADTVRAGAGPGLVSCRLFDVFRGPQVGEGRKSLAYRLRLDDPERQLTDADADAAIESIEAVVSERLGGHLRR